MASDILKAFEQAVAQLPKPTGPQPVAYCFNYRQEGKILAWLRANATSSPFHDVTRYSVGTGLFGLPIKFMRIVPEGEMWAPTSWATLKRMIELDEIIRGGDLEGVQRRMLQQWLEDRKEVSDE